MNKRANRVYWLLAIMLFIFFMSIIIDCIRAGIRNSQVDSVNVEENVEVSSEMTSVEITTENTTKVESTETTSELSNTDVQKVKEFYNGKYLLAIELCLALLIMLQQQMLQSGLIMLYFCLRFLGILVRL
ncbi:MAG: hypothetical protein V8S74_08120 [Lachnospirales bacterium]